jgi:hypothetical protein
MSARIAGELTNWPAKDLMAKILRDAGLCIEVGRYSIRVQNCPHFVFQEYGQDLGDPTVDADAETVEGLTKDARLVSGALADAGIKHRFEIYDERGEMAGYLHYEWPLKDDL